LFGQQQQVSSKYDRMMDTWSMTNRSSTTPILRTASKLGHIHTFFADTVYACVDFCMIIDVRAKMMAPEIHGQSLVSLHLSGNKIGFEGSGNHCLIPHTPTEPRMEEEGSRFHHRGGIKRGVRFNR